MSEQLSAYTENTPQHIVEDTRQELISRLLDERQKLVIELRTKLLGDKVLEAKELAKIEEEIQKDPNVVAINERLLELAGPRAASKFVAETKSQIEGVLSGATDQDSIHEILRDLNNTRQRSEVSAGDGVSITELEQRNVDIWNRLVSATFEQTVIGIREKFILMRESVDEYKADIKTCLSFLSEKRQIYYEKQMADLDKQISILSAQNDPSDNYYKLSRVSKDILENVELYKQLHISCLHEVSKKII